jgi:hypothetical protein
LFWVLLLLALLCVAIQPRRATLAHAGEALVYVLLAREVRSVAAEGFVPARGAAEQVATILPVALPHAQHAGTHAVGGDAAWTVAMALGIAVGAGVRIKRQSGLWPVSCLKLRQSGLKARMRLLELCMRLLELCMRLLELFVPPEDRAGLAASRKECVKRRKALRPIDGGGRINHAAPSTTAEGLRP